MADPERPNETPPGPSEAALWAWLETAVAESARIRRDVGRFHQFDEWFRLFSGQHYPETMPSYRPPVVANELRTLVLSEASDLVDADLRVFVTRRSATRGGRDEMAERALQAVWVRQSVDLKLLEAVVWALICGTGFLRVGWDPHAGDGLGDVVVDALDPRVVFPDPDALDDRSWAYVVTETVLDLDEIRRLFPQRGMLVKPEDAYSLKELSGVESSTLGGTPKISGWSYTGPLTDTGGLVPGYPGYQKARARVLEAYVRDTTVEERIEPLRDPETDEIARDERGEPRYRTVTAMKYPRGRRIVGANGVILYDGPSPIPGRASSTDFGILRVVLEPTLSSFWGVGWMHQTGQLQLAADKLLSALVENAIRLNQGIVLVKGNTGLDWESFAGIPGQVVQIQRDSDFHIVYPDPMPADMVRAPWAMLDLQRRILGFSDPRAGTGGRGNVSPELAETEISQSQGTTRLRARLLAEVVRRLAEMVFARIAWGYTTEREIPVVDGQTAKVVRWTPLDNPEEYQVLVDPASFQVMSESMRRRLALALYRLGAVDRKAVLTSLSWPEGEEIAERMDSAERAAAQAKYEMQLARSRAARPGPGGPGGEAPGGA